jgi:hypothetical protein
MIIVDGRTRSWGARSHRSTPGAQVSRWACTAGPAGRESVTPGAAARITAAVTGYGSIPGSARRLDTQS